MPDANQAAVEIAKEETRQVETLAQAQVKTEEIRAEAQEQAATAVAEAVKEEAKAEVAEALILGQWTEAELLEILDECGRHMMEMEAMPGGEATSPSEVTASPSTSTAVASEMGTSSAEKPASAAGSEAAPAVTVVEVEAPAHVSAAEVKQEQRPSFMRSLIFGRAK